MSHGPQRRRLAIVHPGAVDHPGHADVVVVVFRVRLWSLRARRGAADGRGPLCCRVARRGPGVVRPIGRVDVQQVVALDHASHVLAADRAPVAIVHFFRVAERGRAPAPWSTNQRLRSALRADGPRLWSQPCLVGGGARAAMGLVAPCESLRGQPTLVVADMWGTLANADGHASRRQMLMPGDTRQNSAATWVVYPYDLRTAPGNGMPLRER